MILGRWSLNQVYRRVVCVVLVAQGSLFVSFSIPFFVSSFYPSFQFASHPPARNLHFPISSSISFLSLSIIFPLFSLFLQSHSQYNLTLFLSFFFSTIRHSLFFLLILLFSLFFQFHSPHLFFFYFLFSFSFNIFELLLFIFSFFPSLVSHLSLILFRLSVHSNILRILHLRTSSRDLEHVPRYN